MNESYHNKEAIVNKELVDTEEALLIELSKVEEQERDLAEKKRAIRTILSGVKK